MNGLKKIMTKRGFEHAAAAIGVMLLTAGGAADTADAATLGKFEIVSGIGEPFRGRIEVAGATRHELDTLGARLGSEAAYRQAGVTYSPALNALRFKLAQQRGRRYIDITSAQPFNEPVVDLVVELAWFGGTNTYTYTALVDPAGSVKQEVATAPLAMVRTSTVAAVSRGRSAKPSADAARAAAASAVDEEIKQKEAQAEQKKHQLAAAQERILELQRTVQEQQQMLTAVAADAIASDVRNQPAALTHVSHEVKAAPAVSPKAESDGMLGEPMYLAGGAMAMLLGVVALMRRRRRVGAIEGGAPVEPALQPAG